MNRTKLALLHDADKRRLERLGLDAARRIGFRAQASVMRAYRARRDVGRALAVTLEDLIPILRDGMVVGHLAGLWRSMTAQPRAIAAARASTPPASRAYRVSLDMYLKRLELGPRQVGPLIEAYTEDAVRVLRRATEKVQQQLFTALEVSRTTDEHVRDGAQRLRNAFEATGLEPNNSYLIENLWRTQTAFGYSAGRWEANQDDAVQEILWGYEYTTVGDYRVRPEHQGFDGVKLPKDDPFWATHWPPNGFSCRCSTLELFEEEKIVKPKPVRFEGKVVPPEVDPGFSFNPGRFYRTLQELAA